MRNAVCVFLILNIPGVSPAFPNAVSVPNRVISSLECCPSAKVLLRWSSNQTKLNVERFRNEPSSDDFFGAAFHPLVLRGGAQRESQTKNAYDQVQEDGELSKALELLNKVRI